MPPSIREPREIAYEFLLSTKQASPGSLERGKVQGRRRGTSSKYSERGLETLHSAGSKHLKIPFSPKIQETKKPTT